MLLVGRSMVKSFPTTDLIHCECDTTHTPAWIPRTHAFFRVLFALFAPFKPMFTILAAPRKPEVFFHPTVRSNLDSAALFHHPLIISRALCSL